MNKKLLILPVVLAGLGLASCQKKATTDQTMKVASTRGVAAVALAGQVQNGNYTFKQNASEVANEVTRSTQDVVVVDSALGLHKLVAEETKGYAVTRLVSNNSDYLVPLTANTTPTADSVIVSYAKGSASDLALQKLCSGYWNVNATIKYVANPLEAVEVMLSKKLGELNVDFVVAPYATALISELDLSTATALNSAWASYTETLENVERQERIPGLVTFVSKNAANTKANGLESFYTDLNIGIDNAVTNPDRLKIVMNSYSQDEKQQIQFFETCATLVGEAQKENANKLELIRKDDVGDVKAYLDSFMKLVDAETVDYSSCYFAE